MAIWQIIYHPTQDDKDSPYQYLLALPDREYILVIKRLELLTEMEISQWRGIGWIKIWDGKIWQVDGKQTRVMFCIDEVYIVILHAFKKVKQRTHKRDIRRVDINYADFLESRKRRDEKRKDP